MIETFKFYVELLSNFLTIITAAIAIFIYFTNKDKISSAINFVLNYSKKLTLTDLKYKVERLNDFTTNDIEQKKEIINVLSEIQGQINGNKYINENLEPQLIKINDFIENSRTLTEPKKRSLVSELRECLKNIDISNYQELLNKKNSNG